jgi:hypothetical protein
MTAMVDDDDDDDEETDRYYLVGPDDNDDGDGSWRGLLLVMGSCLTIILYLVSFNHYYRYPV